MSLHHLHGWFPGTEESPGSTRSKVPDDCKLPCGGRVYGSAEERPVLLTMEMSLEQSRFVVPASQTGSNVTQVGLQQVANLGLGLSILLHLLRLLAV